jgi:3-oxoacyl-[acyl-carrier protein] reductase
MDLDIEGKVALVTAASRGLGFASASALLAEGCRVAICGRDPERLASAQAELGEDAFGVVADVSTPDTPARLVKDTVDRFGRLDIVVANAGGPPKSRAVDVQDGPMLDALQANLLTSIRLVQSALPHLRATGAGRIVCITSSAVKQPIPDLAYSNTARTGLWGWAKTAAIELAPEGITLNLVCPGLHATDRALALGSEGPFGDPADLGRVVAFLCSASASFISGVALQVDGAHTVGLL